MITDLRKPSSRATTAAFPTARPRRLRRTAALRHLVRETRLTPADVIYPMFVRPGSDLRIPIASMPGQFQHTLESLRKEAVDIASRGVTAFMVFAVPEHKNADGSEASNPDGIAQRAITMLHDELGDEHVVIGDLCLDEYTDHGHCGVLTMATSTTTPRWSATAGSRSCRRTRASPWSDPAA